MFDRTSYNVLSAEDYERFADERDYPLFDDAYWEDVDEAWRCSCCSDDVDFVTELAFRDAWWLYTDDVLFEECV
jgi:hypothetical protein